MLGKEKLKRGKGKEKMREKGGKILSSINFIRYGGSTVVQSSGSTVVLQWFYSGSTKLMSFLSFQFLNLAVLTRTHCRAH